MAGYIDKEQLKNSVKRYFKHLIDKGKYEIDILDANADIHKIISELPAIERLPATDVVQVVRCINCKHSKYKPIVGMFEECEQTALLHCTMFIKSQHIYEDDFCSYGER